MGLSQTKRVRPNIVLGAVLVLLVFAVFSQTLRFDFITVDDPAYVTDNPDVRAGFTVEGFRAVWTSFVLGHWHPITHLSYLLDYTIFGLNPAGFHFTNVLLHGLNTLLVFKLLTRMTGFVWRAAFVAALFAVHPLHVESVAWVAERKDVLSAFFALWAMLVYTSWTHHRGAWRYALLVTLFALAVMSKAIVVTVPCLLLLLDLWPLKRIDPRERWPTVLRQVQPLIVEKLPLFAISIAGSIMTVWASRVAFAVRDLEQLPIGYRLANATVSYGTYLKKMVWPTDLAAFYPHLFDALPRTAIWGSGAVLLAITAVAMAELKRRPYLLVGWLWFLGLIVPVSGLFQVGDQAMADRYTYLSLIGVFVAAVWFVADWLELRPAWRPIGVALTVAVTVAFTLVAWRQTSLWRDTITLYEHTLAVTPDNEVTRQVLGHAYLMEGRAAEAEPHYRRALEFQPDHAEWTAFLGYTRYLQNDFNEARALYERALDFSPENVEALNNLGLLHLELGEYGAAEHCFAKVVELRPNHEGPRLNLAITLAFQHRFDEATGHFRHALEIDPLSARSHYNFGAMLVTQGRYEEAIPHLRFVVEHGDVTAFKRAGEKLALAIEADRTRESGAE